MDSANIDVLEGLRQTPQAPAGNNPDDALLVKFYIDSVEDLNASKEEGRPVFRDEEMIDIRVPGSRNNVVRVAREADKQRFPRHYAAFKLRVSNEEALEGMPLAEWPGCTRAQADELSFLGVKTVEQLAQVPDSKAGQFMGFYGLKQKAKDWLEKASSVEALQAELKARDDTIAELTKRLEALEIKAAPKKKVTRKKTAAKKE